VNFGAPAIEDQVWGHHLTQDILHDELEDTSYALAGIPEVPGGELNTTTTLFARARARDPTFAARENAIIKFSINKGSETFQAWNAPRLHPGGNENIGIVQDAGKFITGLLGAQNVITFGHVLDPAGTTVAPITNPVLFIPNAGRQTLRIGLRQFGFNDIIPEITVSNLTAGTVKCVWRYNGRDIDAIAKTDVVDGRELTRKQINNSRTENAGFFVSREDARGEGNLEVGIDLRPYKIGKTLGDTLLVASAMPMLKDNAGGDVYNTFCGILPPAPPPGAEGDEEGEEGMVAPPALAGQWQWFAPPDPKSQEARAANPTPPQILALKTIDRLNHVRAVLKDVPSILDSPAPKGAGRLFEFFPGEVNQARINEQLITAYAQLAENVKARYNVLIAAFNAGIVAAGGGGGPGSLNPRYATFSEGAASLRGDNQLQSGARVFERIVKDLTTLRDDIVQRFNNSSASFNNNPTIELYEKASEFANRLSPPTATLLTSRDFMKQSIVVITAPSGGYVGLQGPLCHFNGLFPITIMLHSLFMKIGRGVAFDNNIYTNTLFDDKFLAKLRMIRPNNPGCSGGEAGAGAGAGAGQIGGRRPRDDPMVPSGSAAAAGPISTSNDNESMTQGTDDDGSAAAAGPLGWTWGSAATAGPPPSSGPPPGFGTLGSPAVTAPVAVDENYDENAFNEFIKNITTPFASLPEIAERERVYISRVLNNSYIRERLDVLEEDGRCPLLTEFTTFVQGFSGDSPTDAIMALIRINRHQEDLLLYSNEVLRELIDELKDILLTVNVDDNPITFTDLINLDVDDRTQKKRYATRGTILYNAFVFRKNADYAMDPGATGLDVLFDSLSFDKYKTSLTTVRGRPPTREDETSSHSRSRSRSRTPRVTGRLGYPLDPRPPREMRVGGSGRRTFRRRLRNKHLKSLHRTVKTGIEPA